MNEIKNIILEDQDLQCMLNLAENLQFQNLEGNINAHKVYNTIIDKLLKERNKEISYLIGKFHQKLWEIEKKFGWHDKFLSQAGQDKIIYDHFFKWMSSHKYFVDIGAYDGVKGSNSYFFEKHLNWKGVLIEPSRKQFEKLQKNRSNECINTAISNKVESLEFVEVVNGLTQMSGLNTPSFEKNYEYINSDIYSETEIYEIKTSTFNELIKQRDIDYLSIDIEGGELSLLESLDFDFYNIKVISIENNQPNDISYYNLMKQNGFQFFHYIGADEIYYNPQNLKL